MHAPPLLYPYYVNTQKNLLPPFPSLSSIYQIRQVVKWCIGHPHNIHFYQTFSFLYYSKGHVCFKKELCLTLAASYHPLHLLLVSPNETWWEGFGLSTSKTQAYMFRTYAYKDTRDEKA